MKTGKLIAKIAVAAVAVAGVVFVVATYGDKIVAWCKKLISSCKKSKCDIIDEATVEEDADVTVEVVVEEEAAAEEAAVEENDFEN